MFSASDSLLVTALRYTHKNDERMTLYLFIVAAHWIQLITYIYENQFISHVLHVLFGLPLTCLRCASITSQIIVRDEVMPSPLTLYGSIARISVLNFEKKGVYLKDFAGPRFHENMGIFSIH